MRSEIVLDTEYQGYIFVGSAQGTMVVEGTGEVRPYYQMFVVTPASTWQSESYQAFGFKAEKKRCVSADVWKDIDVGCRVKLYFDDKQRVVLAQLDQ